MSITTSSPREKAVSILLVEDSPVHIELIRAAIAKRNRPLHLHVARSLAEARNLMEREHPDLGIIDLMLPDGKGVELLPPHGDRAPFPMLIMTSNGNEKEAVEAMKRGALDYLVKSEETLAEIPYLIDRALAEWHHLTERLRAEEELRQSEERFRSVFTIAAAGMVIISPGGAIIQANPAFCSFTGYSESELESLCIDDIIHPEDRSQSSLTYREILAGSRQSLHKEERYVRKDGNTVWGHVSVACVKGANRTPLYCVGLVQDITDRKRMEEELTRRNRELDAFVYTVSHDLRSPLTPIIGYADYLHHNYRERLDPEACNLLTEISRQGFRMLGLMKDLLALARVGHLERPEAPVDCDDVVNEVLDGLGNRIAEAGVQVEKGDLPSLRVPKSLLSQIFDNLIVNALEYGASTDAPIEVRGERQGEKVTLSVCDHGPGIPVEERSSIFDLFYRGSTSQKVEGTGVGLATVKKIASLYGGRVWIEETPGGGSTFHIELADAPPATG